MCSAEVMAGRATSISRPSLSWRKGWSTHGSRDSCNSFEEWEPHLHVVSAVGRQCGAREARTAVAGQSDTLVGTERARVIEREPVVLSESPRTLVEGASVGPRVVCATSAECTCSCGLRARGEESGGSVVGTDRRAPSAFGVLRESIGPEEPELCTGPCVSSGEHVASSDGTGVSEACCKVVSESKSRRGGLLCDSPVGIGGPLIVGEDLVPGGRRGLRASSRRTCASFSTFSGGRGWYGRCVGVEGDGVLLPSIDRPRFSGAGTA